MQQDHKPLEPPADLGHLFEGGTIPTWKLGEALTIWVGFKNALASGGDPSMAEKFFVLTLVLGGHEGLDGDVRRAVLETSLDVLTLPRHRQVVLALLSAGASTEMDMRSAAAWLESCDPESTDLLADSAWRIARATIAAEQGDQAEVLSLLEPGGRPWPIHDSMDAKAVVLRADAHEKLGRVEQATAIVEAYIKEVGFAGRALLEKAANPKMGRPRAQETLRRVRENIRKRAAETAGTLHRFIGYAFGSAGVFVFLLMGFLTFKLNGKARKEIAEARRSGQPEWVVEIHKKEIRTMYILDGVFGTIGLGLLVGSVVLMSKARQQRRIVEHGVQVMARVVDVTMTGTRVNHVPIYKLKLAYTLPDGSSHTATVKELMDPARAARMQGGEVAVWVDPSQPDKAVL